MHPPAENYDIVRLVQIAIAPVFLLTAVSATLSVLAARIARVIDRGRYLERQPVVADSERIQAELSVLERRARTIYWGMTLGTVAAILVCVLIISAFTGYLTSSDPTWAIALLFIAALSSYTGALLCLLREVTIAISSFRLGITGLAPK
jgi:hypothetical protein